MSILLHVGVSKKSICIMYYSIQEGGRLHEALCDFCKYVACSPVFIVLVLVRVFCMLTRFVVVLSLSAVSRFLLLFGTTNCVCVCVKVLKLENNAQSLYST